MYFTIWTEKIENKGEDAPPTLLLGEDDTVILAVYDGLGGAGSRVYALPNEKGEIWEYSGAYLASRLAKAIVEDFYLTADLNENFVQIIQSNLQNDFNEYAQQLANQPSKLKSRLIRTLPTTIAGMLAEENRAENLVNAWAFWAGDSRCYVWQKESLQQISQDDLTGNPDAMANLEQDATINNCVQALGDFVLHQRIFSFAEPTVLIVATDGCFGYLSSPMDFEYLLLQTLAESQYDFEDWQYQLTEAILQTTGDDASMSLWAWGFENLNDLKNYFFDRQQVIYQTYIQPLVQADKPASDLRQTLWQEYKKNYYLDISSENL
jgi:serine/threonine protein phosphatase PrpC